MTFPENIFNQNPFFVMFLTDEHTNVGKCFLYLAKVTMIVVTAMVTNDNNDNDS